jgi:hypothetical protein
VKWVRSSGEDQHTPGFSVSAFVTFDSKMILKNWQPIPHVMSLRPLRVALCHGAVRGSLQPHCIIHRGRIVRVPHRTELMVRQANLVEVAGDVLIMTLL